MYHCKSGPWHSRTIQPELDKSARLWQLGGYHLTWHNNSLTAHLLEQFSKQNPCWAPGLRLPVSGFRSRMQEWLKRLTQLNGWSPWFMLSHLSPLSFCLSRSLPCCCGNTVSLLLWCMFPTAAPARPHGFYLLISMSVTRRACFTLTPRWLQGSENNIKATFYELRSELTPKIIIFSFDGQWNQPLKLDSNNFLLKACLTAFGLSSVLNS